MMTWCKTYMTEQARGRRAVIYWQDKTYYVQCFVNNNQLVDVQRGPGKSWGWARRCAEKWMSPKNKGQNPRILSLSKN